MRTLLLAALFLVASAGGLAAADPPGLDAAFDIVDVNHDGRLDAAERERALALDAPIQGAGERSARKLALFRYLDVNGDGRISRAEAAELDALARNFSAFDENHDGGIDAGEFGDVRLAALARPPAAPPSASAGSSSAGARAFRELDRNGDGYLSRRELRTRGGRVVDWLALDRNGDGLISPSEFGTLRGTSPGTPRAAR